MSHTYTPAPATAQAPRKATAPAPTTAKHPAHAHSTVQAPTHAPAPATAHATTPTPAARGYTCVTLKWLMPLHIRTSHALPLCACVPPIHPLHCAAGHNDLTHSC
ncbi:hypothetical protein O181_024630 [Austropuccinia psidii MF-1]|uniref:Uncharacterized protein n=1 Tax=Austropuccinia psidii MF-1 TaxID=1389203 RepID=A0A9Q3H0A9_9BASI|nr:hypothetical protein [Austropuccinia psidii MF-1]